VGSRSSPRSVTLTADTMCVAQLSRVTGSAHMLMRLRTRAAKETTDDTELPYRSGRYGFAGGPPGSTSARCHAPRGVHADHPLVSTHACCQVRLRGRSLMAPMLHASSPPAPSEPSGARHAGLGLRVRRKLRRYRRGGRRPSRSAPAPG